MNLAKSPWRLLGIVGCVLAGTACSSVSNYSTESSAHGGPTSLPVCTRMIKAEVVALEQAIVLNRFGAFNPSGMLFALKRDVVLSNGTPLNEENIKTAPGNVRLRDDKRPRPLVLRINEGDCLEVRFHNLLMPAVPDERTRGRPGPDERDVPAVQSHGRVHERGVGPHAGVPVRRRVLRSLAGRATSKVTCAPIPFSSPVITEPSRP